MKILFLIAQEGFRDEEFFEPYGIFEQKHQVTVASIEEGICTGKLGRTANADISVKHAKIADYDAFVIAGGPGASKLGDYPEVIAVIKKAFKHDKIVGAICIAPTLLAKAGVLEGKTVTVWNGDSKQKKVVEDAGARYSNRHVVIDGKLVTADGPAAAKGFAEAILKLGETVPAA